MQATRSATDILNREYLEIRCKILELAAAMDRLERAPGSVSDDARMTKIREALGVVADERGDRAEQVQLIFSRQYHEGWQRDFDLQRRT